MLHCSHHRTHTVITLNDLSKYFTKSAAHRDSHNNYILDTTYTAAIVLLGPTKHEQRQKINVFLVVWNDTNNLISSRKIDICYQRFE